MHINNPIDTSWHADPEARFYEGEYWIYATRSLPFKEQHNLDAYHSVDGKEWIKEESIIDMTDFPFVWQAVWAPTIIDKDGKYYLILAVNDIHANEEPGGLLIVVADSPKGPFKRFTKADELVGDIINGAQPIDAHLFKDDDGTIYLYYGGWGHCNVGIMNETMDGLVPFADGDLVKEITPPEYVEGPCMFKKDGKYYFQWSVGGWTTSTYGVCYAISDNPFGPFDKYEKILETDMNVAKGPGHHGYLIEGDDYYIVYHRRPLTETDGNSRQLSIDRMYFDGEKIRKIQMT